MKTCKFDDLHLNLSQNKRKIIKSNFNYSHSYWAKNERKLENGSFISQRKNRKILNPKSKYLVLIVIEVTPRNLLRRNRNS